MTTALTQSPARKRPPFELRAVGLRKSFGGVEVLHGVDLTIRGGKVVAVLGENGAGKSTLIKIMTGVYQPDRGEIRLEGRPVHIHNSQEAQALGIAAIYQEPMVFPDLNVAENIFISHQDRGRWVRWGKMYADAEAILGQLDVRLDVRQPARGLTLAAQQAVEIAKAISLKVRVLIMDEPTASLSAHEVEQLFQIVRRLRDQGVAILFIGHRLEEVMRIADRITVLRDGRLISSAPREQVTVEGVIRDMVGRTIEEFFAKKTVARGDLLLSVRGLSKAGVFHDIHFDLYCGEVLGFAGLIGARRTDVALALFGVEPADAGQIWFAGREVVIRSPAEAQRLGIAYATEDRRKLGLITPMSVAANITLPTLPRYLSRLGLLRRREEAAVAEDFRRRLSIRTPSVRTEVGKLSGGNQQKVVLGRWLENKSAILVLAEPTRGVDVGARAEIYDVLKTLAEEGIAILIISTDAEEVLRICDRIVVMSDGRVTDVIPGHLATMARLAASAAAM
ncbi:MAG: sugar ABC transporter ATP-binding protein [Caldilineales bacterium]|nr:sugar ABC transporter ATP-binding protein [Caldilineales bacterium]